MIFEHQDSDLMKAIKEIPVCELEDCCVSIISKLSENIENICFKTKDWYAY